MPRTKGSKNRVTASTDFDAQIEKLQKDKVTLEEGLSKTVAQIEELKTDIKSLRESLKPQKAEIKQTEKKIANIPKATAAEKAAGRNLFLPRALGSITAKAAASDVPEK